MAKTIQYKTTYLGIPCEVKEIRESGASGPRELRYRWLAKAVGQQPEWEAGTVVSMTVTGNQLRGTFRVNQEPHVIDEF